MQSISVSAKVCPKLEQPITLRRSHFLGRVAMCGAQSPLSMPKQMVQLSNMHAVAFPPGDPASHKKRCVTSWYSK